MARRPRPPQRSTIQPADSPLLQAARRAFMEHRYDDSLEQFDLAVQSLPKNPVALVDAARAHALRHDRARAAALAGRLQRLAPDDPEIQIRAGELYRLMDLRSEAVECFERLATSPRPQPRALLELAAMYERLHRLDEARAAVDRLLHLDPQHAGGQIVRARIERRQGALEAAISTLRQLLSRTELEPRIVAEAWGDLARALDEQGDYDAAWEAILQCKAAQLPRAEPAQVAARHVAARCSRMLDELTTAHFRRWKEPPHEDAPRRLALLTGFLRSGTTLLEQVLKVQPDVISTEERDIFSANIFPFLGRGKPNDFPVVQLLDELVPSTLVDARRRYERVVEAYHREPLAGRLHIDKNPAMNLMIPLVTRVFPETRLLVTLRDPRDVILSSFLRYLAITPVSVNFLSLEGTVDKYLFDMQAWLRLRELIATPWLEIRYEQVIENLEAEARRVFEFLGLAWNPAALAFHEEARRRPATSPSYAEVTSPIHRRAVARWRHYERHLAPQLDRLGPILEALRYA